MPESLFHLATKKVAECIHNGCYKNVNYKLDPKSSNEIYTQLQQMVEGRSDRIALEVAKKFQLTEVDFRNYKIYSLSETVKMLKTMNLESLKFGEIIEVEQLSAAKSDDKCLDIAMFLENILNKKYLKNLQHLEFKGNQSFVSGWTEQIGTLFPSIKSLIIVGKLITTDEFSKLCNSFPHLQLLDISNTGISNLNGISKLKNLRVLTMRNLVFNSHYDLMDLFDLTNLRELDLSNEKNETQIIKQYLECGKFLPLLRSLDCCETDMNDQFLKQLLESHGKLERVDAIGNDLDDPAAPNICLLISATLLSTIDSINHYLNLNKPRKISMCLEELFKYICREYECEIDLSQFCELEKLVRKTMEKSSSDSYYCRKIQMTGKLCLIAINVNTLVVTDLESIANISASLQALL